MIFASLQQFTNNLDNLEADTMHLIHIDQFPCVRLMMLENHKYYSSSDEFPTKGRYWFLDMQNGPPQRADSFANDIANRKGMTTTVH